MICQNCSSANPDGQAFCGRCGHRLIAETIGSLSERLAKMEHQQLAASQDKISQKNLEIQTAENVMTRVKKWTTLILYFAGIPAAIALLSLAVVFGKGSIDIYEVAAHAKTSVGAVLKQAQTEASDAENTASGALATSKQTDEGIRDTQDSVSKLRTEVNARSADVQKLSTELNSSRQQLDSLTQKLNAQEAALHNVTEQTQAVQTSRGAADVQAVYPIYGEHTAHNRTGYINPKAKPPNALYLDLNLSLTQTPNVSDEKVGEAISALTDHKYTVTIGSVYVQATTASGSAQAVGMDFDSNSCTYWPKPAAQPPCILYFRDSLKDSAMEVRDLVKVAQEVPDDHIFFVDPAKLDAQQRELLELSATDFVVVLGQ